MRFMQFESVLQTKNRSEPAKNRFSVALDATVDFNTWLCRGKRLQTPADIAVFIVVEL